VFWQLLYCRSSRAPIDPTLACQVWPSILSPTARPHLPSRSDSGRAHPELLSVWWNQETVIRLALALKQSSIGFMAARHVLRCFGGPAWKDTANINLNPRADAIAYLTESASADVRARVLARIAQINGPPDSDNAREIIAGKLAQLAARNGEIGDSSGPVE